MLAGRLSTLREAVRGSSGKIQTLAQRAKGPSLFSVLTMCSFPHQPVVWATPTFYPLGLAEGMLPLSSLGISGQTYSASTILAASSLPTLSRQCSWPWLIISRIVSRLLSTLVKFAFFRGYCCVVTLHAQVT